MDRSTQLTKPSGPAAGLSSESVEPRPAPSAQAFVHRHWAGRAADLEAALTRIDRLRPVVEPILESEGVPRQLLAVVLVESAGRPTALSPKQARGLWQFIPATARRYGLRVSGERDDRIHIERSTRAAARYLRDLYSQFGNWPLALAAYNAGEGRVARAIERAGSSDFWAIASRRLLPMETRNYVPAVLAAVEILGGELHRTAEQRAAGIIPWTS